MDVCADDESLLTQAEEDKENTNKRTAVGLSVFGSPQLGKEISICAFLLYIRMKSRRAQFS